MKPVLLKIALNGIPAQLGVDNIIVPCNGCTDNTVEIVTTKFPNIICLDIEKPSKTNALNVAEEKAKELGISYPVFYIDADTQLSENAIQHISNIMESGEVLLAAPTPKINTDKSSFLVKNYYIKLD